MIYLYHYSIVSRFTTKIDPQEFDRLFLKIHSGKGGIDELQDLISENLRDTCRWMTSLSIIDCAEKIVKYAKENGNISENTL